MVLRCGATYLGTVTHKVESSHQYNKVDEELPVVLECDLTLGHESLANV